jgi:hypothetical protein
MSSNSIGHAMCSVGKMHNVRKMPAAVPLDEPVNRLAPAARLVLEDYLRKRRDWRRFVCDLPNGEFVVVGDLCGGRQAVRPGR